MRFDLLPPASAESLTQQHEKEKEAENAPALPHKNVVLPRRSLIIMTGEARYCWQHAITHRRTDKINGRMVKRQRRVSLTFRRVRRDPCCCSYPDYCDSQLQRSDCNYLSHKREKALKEQLAREKAASAEDSLAPTFEEMEHVHKVFQIQTLLRSLLNWCRYMIALPHTLVTPARPNGPRWWPSCKTGLLAQWWPIYVRLSLFVAQHLLTPRTGCGNGKYLDCNADCSFIGCDRSIKLIDICKERGFEVFVCDALKVPFRDNSFDLGTYPLPWCY